MSSKRSAAILTARTVTLSDHMLRRKMDELLETAKHQIQTEVKPWLSGGQSRKHTLQRPVPQNEIVIERARDVQDDQGKQHILTPAQTKAFYGKAFIPINLNTGTKDEFLLIPGVGARMSAEFAEYRPWKTWAQFDKEIGEDVVRRRPTD